MQALSAGEKRRRRSIYAGFKQTERECARRKKTNDRKTAYNGNATIATRKCLDHDRKTTETKLKTTHETHEKALFAHDTKKRRDER